MRSVNVADDRLLDYARKMGEFASDEEAVAQALREYACRRAVEDFASMAGADIWLEGYPEKASQDEKNRQRKLMEGGGNCGT